MITVRNSVFETNSSSTHAISFITNYDLDKLPHYVSFHLDSFGWETRYVNGLDYLYTAIVNYYDHDEAEEKINHLKQLMDEHNIEYKFYPEFDEINSRDWESYYIDHSSDLGEFLEAMENDTNLLRFIASGEVYTTNDNCDHDDVDDPYNEGFKAIYSWDENKNINNPNFNPNRTYFYKGN